jgi:hypothetical protein
MKFLKNQPIKGILRSKLAFIYVCFLLRKKKKDKLFVKPETPKILQQKPPQQERLVTEI